MAPHSREEAAWGLAHDGISLEAKVLGARALAELLDIASGASKAWHTRVSAKQHHMWTLEFAPGLTPSLIGQSVHACAFCWA